MNALQVIEAACAQAMEESEEGIPWEKAFTSIVTPLDARELCAIAREYLQYAADNGDQALVDKLRMRME